MAKSGNADTQRITFKAADAVKTTTAQWHISRLTGSMTAGLASTAADEVIGVIDSNQSESSDYVSVVVHGMTKVVMLSLTVAAVGDFLVASTLGTANAFATNTSNQVILGRALETSRTGGAVTCFVAVQKYGVLD